MANVDIISGEYSIPGRKIRWFQFWWPGMGLKDFFDVTIVPSTGDGVFEIRHREVVVSFEENDQTRYSIWLEIENKEASDMRFNANHVHISK